MSEARNPVQEWGQALGAAVVAATLPLVAAWTLRLAGAGTMPAHADAWVVLVTTPLVVFGFARWAARLASGAPLLHATVVGAAPGALIAGIAAVRDPTALVAGTSPFAPLPIAIWTAVNLASGMLAGTRVRRARRTTAR